MPDCGTYYAHMVYASESSPYPGTFHTPLSAQAMLPISDNYNIIHRSLYVCM